MNSHVENIKEILEFNNPNITHLASPRLEGYIKAVKVELEFLLILNTDNWIKQAEVERSHFYMSSRAKLVKNQINECEDAIKIAEGKE